MFSDFGKPHVDYLVPVQGDGMFHWVVITAHGMSLLLLLNSFALHPTRKPDNLHRRAKELEMWVI